MIQNERNSTMPSTPVKKALLCLCVFVITSLACGLTIDLTPNADVPTAESTPIPVLDPPTPTPEVFISVTQAIPSTPVETSVQSVEVTVDSLTVSLSPELAGGVRGMQIPPADGQDLPYWELTPGHTVFNLEGYLLQQKFHEPQLYIYPALEYAQLVPGAFESMHRLRNVLYDSGSLSADQLPAVPFFNAAQVFASNLQLISFQNGEGVRFLTEYAQYAAPINNHDLFYHFQGFTNDGEYYIIAIFPVTAPVLAETSDTEAVLPAGGIAFPDLNDPNADFQGYYTAVSELLTATPPDGFTPTLSQLDALIQSTGFSR
jgi:hypothetical protein